MISNRVKVLAAGILMIIAIILILLFVHRPTTQRQTTTTTTKETTPTTPAETAPAVPMQTREQKQEVSAATATGIFVERFGSYSSESNLANIKDVLPLATDAYQKQLQALIEKTSAQGVATTYYGVTTRVISKKRVSMDTNAGTAEYEVTTQREESQGSVQASSVRYQNIDVTLKLVGDVWLVDSATWK